MVNEKADAELRVDVVDRMTPALSRMAAQAQAFGKSVGASSAVVDKGVKKISAGMADIAANAAPMAQASKNVTNRMKVLGDTATRQARGIDTLTTRLAAQRAELAKYESAMRGTRVANALAPGGFSVRGADGKFMSSRYLDMGEYNKALRQTAVLERALRDTQAARANTLRDLSRAQAAATYGAGPQTMARPVGWRPGLAPTPAPAVSASVAPMLSQAAAAEAARSGNILQRAYRAVGDAGAWAAKRIEAFPPPAARYALYDLSRTLTVTGGILAGLGIVSIAVASKWEQAFSQVARTTGAPEATLHRIRESLIDLSQTIPVAFTELAEIASVGAQLGIGADGIVAYTSTIAKLTATTNLTAEAAGNALGRFKAFYAEADDPSLAVTESTFSNLASSILKVGINSVATESGIVNVSTQISSMGQYAGFTADQTIGLAGALASVGVPPELSRGVVTRLFNNIGEAVSSGGSRLSDFARIAGVSASEFQAAWGTDRFAYIFTDFVRGLERIQNGGGDAVGVLHELGITSVRDVPVLLRLANAAGEAGTAGSLLAQTMNDAREGWRANIELQLQYAIVTDTVAAKAQLLAQNITSLFAAFGQGGSGPLKTVLDILNTAVESAADFARSDLGQWLGSITVAVSVLGGGLLLLGGMFAASAAAGVGLNNVLVQFGVTAATATAAARVLSVAIASIGLVGLVMGAIGLVGSVITGAQNAGMAISDTQGAINALRTDTESAGAAYHIYSNEVSQGNSAFAEAATKAENLTNVTLGTRDALYGAGDAAATAADQVSNLAYKFGDASSEFVKSQLLQSTDFQNLFGTQNQDFVDTLLANGFDFNKMIRIVRTRGEAAGREYIGSILGVTPDENFVDHVWGDWLKSGQTARFEHLSGEVVKFVGNSITGFDQIVNQAMVTGEGLGTSFTNAYDISGDALKDFTAENEDAIDKIGKAYAKFVDSGSLIKFTQALKEAQGTKDDPATPDVNESKKAAEDWEKSWTDAYGGAGFSIAEYMTVFRRAATEQTNFATNINALMGRGVPKDILIDLAQMGPEAARLVEALVTATDAELDEYVALYQKTGFDSMVGMAAGQLAAQNIVNEAARHLSTEQLMQLSADLAAGTPLIDAMAKWNLDAQGKPMKAPVDEPVVPLISAAAKAAWERNNILHARIIPTMNPGRVVTTQGDNGVSVGFQWRTFATGGYTGPGGKYEPRGVVHADEFVFDKESTRAAGPRNLYALMRSLRGGRPAARPGGFAGGGLVGGGPAATVVELSARDRKLLERLETYVMIGDDVVSRANGRSHARSARGGRG